MKSLQELQAIRDKMKANISTTRDNADAKVRVVVGMATCGIAAGARPVLNTLVEEVNKADLCDKVTVSQTGCIGYCQLEPIVEIHEAGKEKITYIHMTADKAREVVEKHLKGGKVVSEYTVSDDN